jgi:hypothetical protein
MVRPDPNSLDLPWGPNDPCPCLSGKRYSECCLRSDDLPLVDMPSLSPPEPDTGRQNAGCYMQSTANCSEKLSREHYVSKNILEQFKRLAASGLPWHSNNEKVEYGINALTSKILCTRHNSALAPLDSAAGHAFRQITDAMIYVTKRSLARAPRYYLVSGDALQLWGIKTLMGLFSAKVASAEGKVLTADYEVDIKMARKALSGEGLPRPLGLYIHPSSGDPIGHEIGLSPLTAIEEKVLAGIRVNMAGITLDFILDKRGGNPVFFKEASFYKPWILDLNGKNRTARIVLTWAARMKTATRVSMDIARR